LFLFLFLIFYFLFLLLFLIFSNIQMSISFKSIDINETPLIKSNSIDENKVDKIKDRKKIDFKYK